MRRRAPWLPEVVDFLMMGIFAIAEVLIFFRVLLKLFGARQAAPFVGWVYETSAPLLAPFAGMFPSPRLEGGFVLEFSALFGLLVYAFAGYLLHELLAFVEYEAAKRETPPSVTPPPV